jgi:hypothetical protein
MLSANIVAQKPLGSVIPPLPRARRRRFGRERLRKDPSLAKLSCNSKHSQAYGNPSMFLNRDLHHYLLKPQPKS